MKIKPEEKAIDLVRRFVIKEMAVMCVDEIILTIKKDSDFTTTYEESKRYWNGVRECIIEF